MTQLLICPSEDIYMWGIQTGRKTLDFSPYDKRFKLIPRVNCIEFIICEYE